MVHNSTFIECNGQNSSRGQLIVNTSSFNGEDLKAYISLSEEIERSRRLHKKPSFTLKAHMTREEIFECSALDDDEFLTALEHQNSYPSLTANFTRSLENIMKYFNEDVDADLQRKSPVPNKFSTENNKFHKLRAAENLTHKPAKSAPIPIFRFRQQHNKVSPSIKELKNMYESSSSDGKVHSSKWCSRQSCQLPSPPCKSRVKQIAQMFNAKITQMMARSGEKNYYVPLENDLSPIAAGSHAVNRSGSKSVQATQKRQIPVQSTHENFQNPSERCKALESIQNAIVKDDCSQNCCNTDNSSCLIAEEIFGQLSVKDKVLLYTKFIEDMALKDPKFNKQLMEAKVKRELERDEIINEKEETVKYLARELEAKGTFHKQTSSPVSSNKILSTHTMLSKQTTPTTPGGVPYSGTQTGSRNILPAVIPAKNAEFDMTDSSQESLHVSSLTIVLKPSPEARKSSLQSLYCPISISQNEPSSKRSNDAIRSTLPIEAYAPPKKIRRTRAERLAPRMVFKNQYLESLFYSWLKEKNGLTLENSTNTNQNVLLEGSISTSASAEEQENYDHALDEGEQNSLKNRLFKEARTNLEQNSPVEESEQRQISNRMTTKAYEENTVNNEKETPLARRHVKRNAPPIPAQRTSLAITANNDLPLSQSQKNNAPKEFAFESYNFKYVPPELISLCLQLPQPMSTPTPPTQQTIFQNNVSSMLNDLSTLHSSQSSTDNKGVTIPIPRQQIASIKTITAKGADQLDKIGETAAEPNRVSQIEPDKLEILSNSENSQKTIEISSSDKQGIAEGFSEPNQFVHLDRFETSNALSKTASSKQSETEESESGLSSMPKITTDESQPEREGRLSFHCTTTFQNSELDFVKPVRPPRKRKMRRTLSWKKENSIVESKPTASTTPPPTTDSDSDYKQLRNFDESKKTSPPMPPKPRRSLSSDHAKKCWMDKICNRSEITTTLTSEKSLQDSNIHELNGSVLRTMNSPSKIKSAYTLTVMSSPLPTAESDCMDSELSSKPFYENHPSAMGSGSKGPAKAADLEEMFPIILPAESFIDQGFETASNELNSPVQKTHSTSTLHACKSLHTTSPLYMKIASELEKSRRLSANYSPTTSDSFDSPSLSSTPVKRQLQQPLGNSVGIQQPLFSPIAPPMKPRRRSFYEPETRRSSLAMQVIREDLALDQQHDQQRKSASLSPEAYNATEDSFFAKATTIDMSSNIEDRFAGEEKSSSYWIASGDFTISIDIYYNSPNRLRWLYDIFSQKNCETHDLHFGIDDHKFSVNSLSERDEVSKRLPSNKDCSHYWFSTSDLTVPFGGKYMSPDKINRLFKFINDSRDENTAVRFGVDSFEFSNIPEFVHNNPKFSIESSYSMLVGLQAGNSNGLEGRSKYAWPSSKSSSLKTSDLDHSEFDSEEFGSSEIERLSFSPFGSNHLDLSALGREELIMPRFSYGMMNPEVLGNYYENEPLDKLFENKKKFSYDTTNKFEEDKKLTIPQMLQILQRQKTKLEAVEKHIRSFKGSTNGIDQFKDSPEYMRYLRRVVKIIDNIGREDNFKTCSLEQLEQFMTYLSRYADIWLAKCSDHMDRILNALKDRRAVRV